MRISGARLAGAVGVLIPPAAAAVVLIGGWSTPGYDPLARTISRLAAPGLAAALAVEVAMGGVGAALIVVALGLGPGARGGRALLVIAGAGLLLASAIRLDPASAAATAQHRVATTVALFALTGAPLAFASALRRRNGWLGYARLSFVFGAAEVAMLLVGLALLPTSFAGWGGWERGFLALPMAWMVLLSWRLLRARKIDPMFSSTAERTSWASRVSVDDTMKAAAANQSSGGL